MLQLDPATTALVLIDLQKGIVGMDLAPISGAEVVATCETLASAFRTAGAPVVLVRVAWAADYADAPSNKVDQPMQRPPGGLPEGFSDLADGLAQPSDIVVTKRHWGAFHGTELDLLLRRRGIRTIVLGGVATAVGVEGTAREAWQHGYDVVVAEDAIACSRRETHETSRRHILPRIARLVRSDAVALTQGR